MEKIWLNDDWIFTRNWTEEFADGSEAADAQKVRLPHTCAETPYNYFDESLYQMCCGYRCYLPWDPDWADRKWILTVGAAGHAAVVYINGNPVMEHHCGYTSFRCDLSPFINHNGDNLLAIRVDSRETQNVPPFGGLIDYMTFGGLYRDVYLEIKDRSYIRDVFARPLCGPDRSGISEGKISSEIRLVTEQEGELTIRQKLTKNGEIVKEGSCVVPKNQNKTELSFSTGKVRLWDIDRPELYTLVTELERGGELIDRTFTRIGFRRAVFRKDGFYLNGKKRKLVGLNRHQSYPYVGYAMPCRIQQRDAEIIKYELHCNAVRTSHYPQSQDFIDRCDEIGLLVFTEAPGWQYIGDDVWKEQAIENVMEMVVQYRNHPSVILWGVRIDESEDDDTFYSATNQVAHSLDPTRPTGGVRNIAKSHLLEDVYTYNDFLHDGHNEGCEKKRHITPDMSKPYLISEFGGHKYPTKKFDDEEHRLEHALRHARILNDIMGEDDIAGGFGWCFSDYNTHCNFGSGDRICYHGISDLFRNPKMAAAVYASQQDQEPVLTISSTLDIGEHPGRIFGEVWVFTNADSIRVFRGDRMINEFFPSSSPYQNLPHPPIKMDDYIGNALENEEHFTAEEKKLMKELCNYIAQYGYWKLPLDKMAKILYLMNRYHWTQTSSIRMYQKYIENRDEKMYNYRFDAVKDGKVVKSVIKGPVKSIHLRTKVGTHELCEERGYDVADVRIGMYDQNENILPFYLGSVRLEKAGPIEIIGPEIITLRGGAGGTYVKTTGKAGDASLTLYSDQAEPVTIPFHITIKHESRK